MKQPHTDARSLAEHLGSEIEMVEHDNGTVSVGEWTLGLLDHDDGAIVWGRARRAVAGTHGPRAPRGGGGASGRVHV